MATVLQIVCEDMVGFARLEPIEVVLVATLQVGHEDMVSIAQLERIEVIVVAW